MGVKASGIRQAIPNANIRHGDRCPEEVENVYETTKLRICDRVIENRMKGYTFKFLRNNTHFACQNV